MSGFSSRFLSRFSSRFLSPLASLFAHRAVKGLRHGLQAGVSGGVTVLHTGLRLLAPSACALCGQSAGKQDALCEACRRQFFAIATGRCDICAMPLPAAEHARQCGECLHQKPAFDATLVATDYVAPLDQLVLALKFNEKLILAPLFARLLADALLHLYRDGDSRTRPRLATLPALLAAVPLSSARLRLRGFNQSLEIARPLARLSGIPLVSQLMRRTRDTLPQSLLVPQQRRSNIADAFSVSPSYAAHIAGLHIGVVDDVITTGHTLNEIALTLKRAGASRVTNLVFARTLR